MESTSSTVYTPKFERLIENYLDGKLPLPGFAVQAILRLAMEWNFHFARAYDTVPFEWSGATGPIANMSEDLMRIHYDKPRMLFENFLGPSMKYTMALYERGAKTLEEAQEQMLDDLCQKVGLQDGDNVLDIACGFGSLSAHILRKYPQCRVTALNLSKVQCDYIAEKQGEAGHPFHTDRFRIIRQNFALSDFDRQFDRVMVIGLFEHIQNLKVSLEKIAGFLKPEGAVLIHYISTRRVTQQMCDPNVPDIFFGRYIFPGGRYWAFNELPRYDQHLKVAESWFINGKNYMRTVQEWRRSLWRNIDVIRQHPEMTERFLRAWDLYLQFCIATFGGSGGKVVGNAQYLLRHARPVT